ncbi:MAG: GNAT family N-acetyltransferase [Fimbriimonadaceae bacterium]
MVYIRRATLSDRDAVIRVIQAVYEEYQLTWDPEVYHADLYDLEGHYFSKGFPFWVAEVDGMVVGTCALEVFPTIHGEPGRVVLQQGKLRVAGTDCSLERMYVDPQTRRMGIGSSLMQTTLEEARHLNRSAMELWSDKKFEPAHRLYEKYGARVVGDRICDDPDESPEWGLYLPLAGTA